MATFILNKKLESTMDYPVGIHIRNNREHISAMIESIESIKEFEGKFINLICRGSSGAIIAGIISVMLKNENRIIHIKKEGEISHNCNIPTLGNDKINIIVDDLICTGKTVNKIYQALTEELSNINLVIDCLCISGTYTDKHVNFNCKYIICGEVVKMNKNNPPFNW